MVQFQELEVAVGDVLRIGEMTVTVIDIENGEVTFRIDDSGNYDPAQLSDLFDKNAAPLPR